MVAGQSLFNLYLPVVTGIPGYGSMAGSMGIFHLDSLKADLPTSMQGYSGKHGCPEHYIITPDRPIPTPGISGGEVWGFV